MSTPSFLILLTIFAIAGLLFLILRYRIPAFLALLLISLIFGVLAGMSFSDAIAAVQSGMGGTLGFVAVVVGLGAMLGALLETSGGIQSVTASLLRRFGEKRAPFALGVVGFLVSIPVFLDVALIILAPVLLKLKERTGKSILYFAIPLLAGMAATHAFVPPTPGPIAVAEILKADLGWVILFGVLAGFPAMIIAGPVFGMWLSRQKGFDDIEPAKIDAVQDYAVPERAAMRFGDALAIIVLPLVLIMVGTITGYWVSTGEMTGTLSATASLVIFLGHPFVALLLACLFAWFLFRMKYDLPTVQLQKAMMRALEPAGAVVLVTGAGGAFKQILVDTGAGQQIAEALTAGRLEPTVFAFVVASIVRIAQGSATVAMITAAGLTAPVAQLAGLSGPDLGLLVIAIGCGATLASHVNDSGFWLVSRYLGLTEAQTLKSWTISSTLVGMIGFALYSFFQ